MADELYRRLSCVACLTGFSPSLKLDGTPRKTQAQYCSTICYSRRYNGSIAISALAARECANCGAKYQPKHKASMYCGNACKVRACKQRYNPMFGKRAAVRSAAASSLKERKQQLAAQKEIDRAASLWWREEQKMMKLAGRLCAVCGSQLNSSRSTCSTACSTEHAQRMRRARRLARKALLKVCRVELVDAIKVFNRDGWTCYLCGCETPKELRGTYEHNAPELEHMTPISRGGAHSYENCRCSCRSCNAIKGDRTVDEIGGEYQDHRVRGEVQGLDLYAT